jgi:murein L,D-transpeptidase YafK
MRMLSFLILGILMGVAGLTAEAQRAPLCVLCDSSVHGSALRPADLIVVRKAQRELAIYREGQLIRSYSIALGRNPIGPKRVQGDGRTPEGRYTIDYRNDRSAYYRALHISYPTAADVRAAQRLGATPGGAIMIHGLPNGVAAVGAGEDWTEGCIAVSNDAMDELWSLVADGTVIEIHP